MNRWITAATTGLIAFALLGCEGAVLVNNRPEGQPVQNTTPQNTTPTTQSSSSVSSDQAQPAAAQQAPDVVNTKNVRVESHGD